MNLTQQALSKVPAVTLGFWVVKILATTLGETGGDAVTMTLLHADERRNWGYLIGVVLFGGALVALVVAQILAETVPFGLVLGDDRRLDDVRHNLRPLRRTDRWGSDIRAGRFCCCLVFLATLALWQWSEGTVSVNTVSTPKVEAFYWATITFSRNAGYRSRRLAGRHARAGLRRWCADIHGGPRRSRGAVLLDQRVSCNPILACVHLDPASRRHRGRLSR